MAEATASPLAAAAATPPPAPEAGKPPPPVAATPQTPAPDLAARIAAERQKREVEKLQKELAALRPQAEEAAKLRQWQERAKHDPAALQELYGDKVWDKLTEWRLSGEKMTPELLEQKLDAKLAEVQAKQDAEAKRREAAAKAEKDADEAAWAESVAEEAKTLPHRLIALHQQHGALAAWIKRNHAETGKLATTQEAADALEASLRKAVLDSLDDDLVTEWSKSRQPPNPAAGASREVRTLHNGITSTTAAPTSAGLTREQRRAAMLKKWEEEEAAGRKVGG